MRHTNSCNRRSFVWAFFAVLVTLRGSVARPQPPAKPSDAAATSAARPLAPLRTADFARQGMCDASASVAISTTHFMVGNDEENILKIYQRADQAEPVQEYDATEFLKPDVKKPETDIEGATLLGENTYWITSHGRSKDGKLRPSRYRLFALHVEPEGEKFAIEPVGKPYMNLLADLSSAPQLQKYNLAQAATLAPKTLGALNIEGLTATPEGHLLIGFRNPIPDDKALLVPLKNPQRVIEGEQAELGDPIELDLAGMGIRSLEWWPEHKQYVIVAGEYDVEKRFGTYLWSGDPADKPVLLEGLTFGDMSPESLIIYSDARDAFQIVSDEGTKLVGGEECKQLADPVLRTFHTLWVKPWGDEGPGSADPPPQNRASK